MNEARASRVKEIEGAEMVRRRASRPQEKSERSEWLFRRERLAAEHAPFPLPRDAGGRGGTHKAGGSGKVNPSAGRLPAAAAAGRPCPFRRPRCRAPPSG